MRFVKKDLQSLIQKIKESNTMHTLRKQLKLDEDPWDNYLIHDSKYFLPLICH